MVYLQHPFSIFTKSSRTPSSMRSFFFFGAFKKETLYNSTLNKEKHVIYHHSRKKSSFSKQNDSPIRRGNFFNLLAEYLWQVLNTSYGELPCFVKAGSSPRDSCDNGRGLFGIKTMAFTALVERREKKQRRKK